MKPEQSKSTSELQWSAWLIDNLVNGVAPEQLITALSRREVPKPTAQHWIDRVQRSDAYKELMRHTRPIRQGQQYLQLRRNLDGLRTAPSEIRSLTHLNAADFFEDYYFENRPVVIRGYADHWAARHKWTPAFIKAQYGDVVVNITDDRLSNPDYDMQHLRHSRACTLSSFVDRVVANDSGNNAYMVANNRAIEHPEFAPILQDVDYDPAMFDASRWKGCSAFWLGPAGTITPTHHDTCNILFVQLYGRKCFRLFSPLESDMLINARSMYSDIDPENLNTEKYPNLKSVREKKAILEPGDAIFLPIGWWHHVRALDVSISFAMTNFIADNQYDWFRPGEVR